MTLGTRRRQVETKGRTLRDLINALKEIAFRELEKEVLTADGSLDPRFKIFVNGRARASLDVTLVDGDDIILFSVIDGG
jgi:molybdopterin converting factor small subunit